MNGPEGNRGLGNEIITKEDVSKEGGGHGGTDLDAGAAAVYRSAGGTVLVSAAANSGKTSVLVQRLVGLITDPEHPVDVDRLLVVTFTKAAAAEMKQRISAELTRLIARHPESRRLQRQQILLPRAHISTVHGFCVSLLREHFQELELSPVSGWGRKRRSLCCGRKRFPRCWKPCTAKKTRRFSSWRS